MLSLSQKLRSVIVPFMSEASSNALINEVLNGSGSSPKNENTDDAGRKSQELAHALLPFEIVPKRKNSCIETYFQEVLEFSLNDWRQHGILLGENREIAANKIIKVGMHSENKLSLRNLQLSLLPEILGTLRILEVLILDNNTLSKLPRSLKNLTNLKVLSLSDNDFQYVPEIIKHLKGLRILNLRHNRLRELPDFIRDLEHLRELNVSGNELKTIPAWIGKLKNLRKINLSNNMIALEEDKRAVFSPRTAVYLNGNSKEELNDEGGESVHWWQKLMHPQEDESSSTLNLENKNRLRSQSSTESFIGLFKTHSGLSKSSSVGSLSSLGAYDAEDDLLDREDKKISLAIIQRQH